MAKKLIFLFSILMMFLVNSQDKNALAVFKGPEEMGDQFYDHLDYRTALLFYQKAFERDPENHGIRVKLGRCNLLLNDSPAAEIILEPIGNDRTASLESRMMYAETLLMNGKYEKSEKLFNLLNIESPGNSEVLSKLEFLQKKRVLYKKLFVVQA